MAYDQQITRERVDPRDQTAFISESQRGPERADATLEVPGYVAVIARPIF